MIEGIKMELYSCGYLNEGLTWDRNSFIQVTKTELQKDDFVALTILLYNNQYTHKITAIHLNIWTGKAYLKNCLNVQ